MKRLNFVIPDAIEAKEVVRTARAQRVLRHWDEIVGKTLAERSRPDRVERGTVWVSVQGAAWAQELRMMREIILSRLRAHGGDPELFKDIRFGVRPTPMRVREETAKVGPSEDLSSLSIREIAERRLARWKSDEATDVAP